MYADTCCAGSVAGPRTGRYVLPSESEMARLPSGLAAVPVTMRKFPAVFTDENVAEMLGMDDSEPFTALCTSWIPGLPVAEPEKLTAATLAPLTVTFWEAG